jgi:hypothetical protein
MFDARPLHRSADATILRTGVIGSKPRDQPGISSSGRRRFRRALALGPRREREALARARRHQHRERGRRVRGGPHAARDADSQPIERRASECRSGGRDFERDCVLEPADLIGRFATS